jgi:Ca2+-binding RTX toxin-like protein
VPFIATGADGNYDFPTAVLLNSGSVALNTLGLEQANVQAGPLAPTLDIEGATLHVVGSVVSTYNPSKLPPGISTLVADAAPVVGFFGITLPQPGGTIDIGSGGRLEVGGSIDAQVAVKFNGGSGNTLRLDAATLPTDTIFGFANGDTIDLAALAPANVSSVSIGAGNTLAIDETNGTTLDLKLDPAQNFAGMTPKASGDGTGGTDISFGVAPVPGPTFTDGGTSSNLVGDNNNDIFIGTTGSDTITTGTGHNLIGPGSGNDIIFAHGSDVIFPDTGGTETIFAFGPVLAAVGSGKMAFINGSNPSTVLGGGSGSATISGGAGGGLYAGGTGGLNVIIGGAGACTMFGSSGSDLLAAGGAGANLLIAGSGNETLTGVGSTGNNVMYAGAGTDLLGGGAGNETFFAGHGNATVIGGSGADLYGFVNGLAGGTETVFGFNTAKGDAISLQGYGPNEAQNDLANAAVGGGNTTLTLSDNTQVTFVGVTGLNASAFI